MLTARNIQGDLGKWLEQVATLNDATPVLLMPLRLEARFLKSSPPGGGPVRDALWVRIFPDDFFLVNHERGLTQRESDAAKTFWQAWLNAGANKEEQVAAWRSLTATVPYHRAAWAMRQLDPRPQNPGLKPGTVLKPTDFPTVALKSDDWTEPIRAIGLPDNFIVVGVRGGVLTHLSIGSPVPESLQVSLNPDDAAGASFAPDKDGNLTVAPELRWLTDPVEATLKGMAIMVDLTPQDAALKFDELYVLGVHTKGNGAAVLERLLEAHRFSPNGLGLVPPGTPTNNTPDTPAGYGSAARDAAWSYELEFGPSPFVADPAPQPDGQRLARALGLGAGIFPNIENRDLREAADAESFRSLLWYGTMGVYMEDFFEKIFTFDNIERTRRFFNRHVAATGTLPVLRAGKQPYGVLPATAFSKLAFTDMEALWAYKTDVTDKEQRLQARFEAKMATFLWELHQYWTQLRNAEVKFLHGNLKSVPDPTNLFLEMLGLQPNSVEYHVRYGANVARSGEAPFLALAPASTSSIKSRLLSLLMAGDYRETPFLSIDNTPTISNRIISRNARADMQTNLLRFWTKDRSLNNPLVALEADPTKPLPPIGTLTKTPIDWLLESALHDIRKLYNVTPDGTNPSLPPATLLFKLLRASLLGVYRKAATRMLLKEGFFDETYLRRIGLPEKFRFPSKTAKPADKIIAAHFTPWSLLFSNMEDLEGMDERSYKNQPLFKHLTQKSLADYLAPSATALREGYPDKQKHAEHLQEIETFRKTLVELVQKPVGQIEPLSRGHIYLSTHR